MPHNHPPRCCCKTYQDSSRTLIDNRCPSCPEHGDLAQSQTEPQCHECHQLAGRPHTVFCPYADWKLR